MSTILVTGGAGFIGSHLCERLLDLGFKVINLDNFNDFYDPKIKRNNILKAQTDPNYVLVEGDIRDKDVLDKLFKSNDIDKVIHLAAIAGVRNSISEPLEYVDVDIKGTVNLLEYSRKHKVKKFVFASSSSVYGTNLLPFKEEDCVNSQVSPYAAAKIAGELFCKTYNHLYKIPVVCLRFFTVYGPRQRPEMAIHKFANLIAGEREIEIFGDGKSSRDYTYIDDVIDGIIASIGLKCDFEVFNLGNSHSVELNQLVSLIERKLGKLAYKKYTVIQKGDVSHTFADTSKAKRMLGYNPKIDIEEGIERFVDWYKNNISRKL